MQFVKTVDEKVGVEAMADKIAQNLLANKKVLWLICGGSNIPYAKEAMDKIRAAAGDHLQALTIGQTDERYGEVGHKDGNWQQMKEINFDFAGVQTLPILFGAPLKETASAYAAKIEDAFKSADLVVAQFGIGADGHIAGMLPHTGGVAARGLVYGYESSPFTRITLTPPACMHINSAYTFAFGESKKMAIEKLQTQELPLADEPCQILKTIPESVFYSDQL